MTANQRVNMNVSGGGKLARYYIAASFSKDNGNLKSNSMNGFDNNINLRSYQLRSNININLTKTTEAVVRLSGTFDDYRGPLDGGDVMYKKIVRSNPITRRMHCLRRSTCCMVTLSVRRRRTIPILMPN